MRSMTALARKDLRILFRLRSGLFFSFVWPVIVAILFGAVFSAQSDGPPRLRVVVVDEDNTPQSRAFIGKLETSGDFTVDRAGRPEAEAMVRRGQRSALIAIKPGFGSAAQRMFYGAPRALEIANDPARQAEASMVEGLVMKHAMSDFQQLFTDPQASRQMVDGALRDLRASGNRAADAPLARFLGELDAFLSKPAAGSGAAEWQPVAISKSAIVREGAGPPNSFAVTFPQGIVWGIIGCVMTFAVSLVSERAHGTFLRLQMAPLTRGEILGGKALACLASTTLLQILLLAIGMAGFGIRPGSWPLLIAACVCTSLAFVGFMMMIASLGRTEQSVAGAGWAMLMPMAMFGGAMMPQFVMPGWMQTVGSASPVKWAILGIEGAMWRGFSAADMLLPCGILLGFGAICFVAGTRGLREA
jgi:ABC-2 type transport system permease protein